MGLCAWHAYFAAEILKYLQPRYIPVKQRGCRPYRRWASNTVYSASNLIRRVYMDLCALTMVHCNCTMMRGRGMVIPVSRLRKGLSRVNRSTSRLWAIVLTFLSLVKLSIGIAVAIQDPLFAIQHMIFCLSANGDSAAQHLCDSDSFLKAIDNCSSKCITNDLRDYVSALQKVNVTVKGIGGTITASLRGTVAWAIEDDDGVRHTFNIPDVYYNQGAP
jgi:hypothetical protein